MPAGLMNYIDDPAFSVSNLVALVRDMPNLYYDPVDFREEGVYDSFISIDKETNGLKILARTERGGPPSRLGKEKGGVISMVIPNFSLEGNVKVADIEGRRELGTPNSLKTFARATSKELIKIGRYFQITKRHLKLGALKGNVKDGANNVIVNLFEAFGIEQKTITFPLSNAAPEPVIQAAMDLADYIQDNLDGEVFGGVKVLCSKDFFDALVKHPAVREGYKFYEGTNPIRENVSSNITRRPFEWQGILWEKFLGKAPNKAGVMTKFIDEGEAVGIPLGTNDTFVNFNAPADFEEAVGTLGLPEYFKMAREKYGRGVDILGQMNPLPICTKPKTLVKVRKT